MAPAKQPKLLVIAGDYNVIAQTRQALPDADIEIVGAYSHRDTMFAIEHELFDAALLDAGMRDRVSGELTLNTLLRTSRTPPLIVLARGENGTYPQPPVEMVIGSLNLPTLARSVQSVLGVLLPHTRIRSSYAMPREDELETVFNLGKSLTEVLDLSEVLNRVVNAARRLTQAEEGMILLPDDEGEGIQLFLRAKAGIDDQTAKNFRIKTDDTLAGMVFHSGQPKIVGAQGPQKVKTSYFVNSLLYVPIVLQGKPIGVLGVNNKNKEEVFDLNQQEILLNLASYAAIAIENARVHEESVQRARELQSLVEATRVVNSSVSLDKTLPNVCRQVAQVLGVNWSEIYEWRRDNNQLRIMARYQRVFWRAGRGPVIGLDRHPALRAAMNENYCLQVARDGEVIPGETDAIERLGVHTLLFVPIQADNQPLGAVRMFFINPPDNAVTPEVIQRVHSLGLEALLASAQVNGHGRTGPIFRVVDEINRVSGADWCELASVSHNGDALSVRLTMGEGVWLHPPYLAIDLNNYPDLHGAVANGTPINVQADADGASKGVRALLDSTYSNALLGLPLVQRGQAQGMVIVGDVRSSRAFNSREIDLGRAIVGQAATALENARLVHDLEQSLIDLKDAQDRLVQTARLSAMGELAAAVAHQINNPLTTILVDTELMLLDEPANGRNYRSLVAISRAGKRAASVVRRLLATARPSEENAPVEPIDVVETIEGILSLVRHHIESDRIQVFSTMPPIRPPVVWAVQGQLDDIWLNLLLNAHDALVGRPDAQVGVEVAYQPDAAHIDVVVWDNGPGIPKHIQAEIFKPFFTTKPVGEGTGLGLHISRQVVDRVGGEISVDSAENQGTRFRVRLPLKKGEL